MSFAGFMRPLWPAAPPYPLSAKGSSEAMLKHTSSRMQQGILGQSMSAETIEYDMLGYYHAFYYSTVHCTRINI